MFLLECIRGARCIRNYRIGGWNGGGLLSVDDDGRHLISIL